jgi:hypothetical protein
MTASRKLPKFRPSVAQLRYITVLLEACALGKKTTDEALAREAGCNRRTLWEWRRKAGFNEWLEAELMAVARRRVAIILNVFGTLAESGSVAHAELFFKYFAAEMRPRNALLQPAASEPAPAGSRVIINLPFPPDELAGHEVVTGMFAAARPYAGPPIEVIGLRVHPEQNSGRITGYPV